MDHGCPDRAEQIPFKRGFMARQDNTSVATGKHTVIAKVVDSDERVLSSIQSSSDNMDTFIEFLKGEINDLVYTEEKLTIIIERLR